MISVNDLRAGVVFSQDGRTYLVRSFRMHKMGRGKNIVNVEVKDMENGGVRALTYKSSDSVEDVQLDYIPYEFVYKDERKGVIVLSDVKTKKRVELALDLLGEGQANYLKSGVELTALVNPTESGDKIYSIMIPKTVNLKVTQAPPAEKGNTATGGSKKVQVETGLTVNTPFFIKDGDVIKVNTETGEYLERV